MPRSSRAEMRHLVIERKHHKTFIFRSQYNRGLLALWLDAKMLRFTVYQKSTLLSNDNC